VCLHHREKPAAPTICVGKHLPHNLIAWHRQAKTASHTELGAGFVEQNVGARSSAGQNRKGLFLGQSLNHGLQPFRDLQKGLLFYRCRKARWCARGIDAVPGKYHKVFLLRRALGRTLELLHDRLYGLGAIAELREQCQLASRGVPSKKLV
jgi:hypothetical protein